MFCVSLHGPFITCMLLFGSLYYIPKKSAVGDILYYISYTYTNIVIQKFEIAPLFGVGCMYLKSIGLVGLSSGLEKVLCDINLRGVILVAQNDNGKNIF